VTEILNALKAKAKKDLAVTRLRAFSDPHTST